MFEYATCWIDGELVPAEKARISVFDHGFLYGDGIFEGVRFYNRKPFRLSRHLKRLGQSAAALRLTLPVSLAALEQAVTQTIAASALDDGYLRILVTRGVGALGINPDSCPKGSAIVIADKLNMISDEQRLQGARTLIAATRRSMPDRLDPRIKSLNYLNNILARMEANFAGVDEAILLNERGCVAEGSAENLFIVKNGELITPAVTEGALSGVTRGTTLELARELGLPAREGVLTPYDLYCADECILTGTGAKLIPVREVDGRPIPCPGPVYRQLAAAFSELVARETA
ncbi:MAG: branched-chain-amino-acid transaminase [Thiothrix sp.]|nr:branched-chain-amino-acid transaminase [Thiothrix sp.]HPQ96842.1 branched-chain-amino-acid transaminase [Thiolinea sp.]